MENKPSLSQKLLNVVISLALSFLLITIFGIALNYLFESSRFLNYVKYNLSLKLFLYLCVFAPISEEFLWRFIPLTILKKTPIYEDSKYYIVVLIGALFGAWHGNYLNIFTQGITGFFFGWVYVRNNSYWWAALTHSLYNFIVIFVPYFIN